MLENEKGIFFQSGSPRPSEMGSDLLMRLTEELKKLPNELLIEGHTDAKPFAKGGDYSNWELSTDRANAARRLMEAGGIEHGRIMQVRGFADTNLRDKENPESASNRRISVIVRYQDAPSLEEEPAEEEAKPGEKGEGKSAEKPAKSEPAKEAKKPEH
jgi:chemotaxis protein MotB